MSQSRQGDVVDKHCKEHSHSNTMCSRPTLHLTHLSSTTIRTSCAHRVPYKRTNAEGESSAEGGNCRSCSDLDMTPSHLRLLKKDFKIVEIDFF